MSANPTINCTFAEVSEQTLRNHVNESQLDMTCEYTHDEGNLTITTRGGQVFHTSTKMPILDVLALEDGLLIKC